MVNKKGLTVIAILIVIVILSWFIYRVFNSSGTEEVISDSNPQVHSIDSKIPPSLKITAPEEQKAIAQGAITGNQKILAKEDENFEIFDKMEKNWLQKAETIMGPQNYRLYLEMRERNDKEKMQAYKEYHEYLRQKYGDKFSYNISEDQSVREKQINQRYLKELLGVIGPEKFKLYTAAKDQLNEEMRRNNKEAIQIEF